MYWLEHLRLTLHKLNKVKIVTICRYLQNFIQVILWEKQGGRSTEKDKMKIADNPPLPLPYHTVSVILVCVLCILPRIITLQFTLSYL